MKTGYRYILWFGVSIGLSVTVLFSKSFWGSLGLVLAYVFWSAVSMTVLFNDKLILWRMRLAYVSGFITGAGIYIRLTVVMTDMLIGDTFSLSYIAGFIFIYCLTFSCLITITLYFTRYMIMVMFNLHGKGMNNQKEQRNN